MKKLIAICSDIYVRNFINTGALSEIEDKDTSYITSPEVTQTAALKGKKYLGVYGEEYNWRNFLIRQARMLMMHGNLDKSTTFALKRLREKRINRFFYDLFGKKKWLRKPSVLLMLKTLGVHPKIRRLLNDLKPDIVIIPSTAMEITGTELIIACKKLGIPCVHLINGWDNLSSKIVYPVNPDYLCVWGPQSAEHAERIHGIPSDRVFAIGSPALDTYFHVKKKPKSPYPFDYALFAGCQIPFDEISSLRVLEETIEHMGLKDFKVVYRPHPWRNKRKCFDVFEPEKFKHIVLDKQVADAYLKSKSAGQNAPEMVFMPSLDEYPALISNARFLICPLSTMTVESTIFGRPVLVLTYHDGIHTYTSPKYALQYDHFRGIEKIDLLTPCAEISNLGKEFVEMYKKTKGDKFDAGVAMKKAREQIRYFIYYDEKTTYAKRLAQVVERIITKKKPKSGKISKNFSVSGI